MSTLKFFFTAAIFTAVTLTSGSVLGQESPAFDVSTFDEINQNFSLGATTNFSGLGGAISIGDNVLNEVTGTGYQIIDLGLVINSSDCIVSCLDRTNTLVASAGGQYLASAQADGAVSDTAVQSQAQGTMSAAIEFTIMEINTASQP